MVKLSRLTRHAAKPRGEGERIPLVYRLNSRGSALGQTGLLARIAKDAPNERSLHGGTDGPRHSAGTVRLPGMR